MLRKDEFCEEKELVEKHRYLLTDDFILEQAKEKMESALLKLQALRNMGAEFEFEQKPKPRKIALITQDSLKEIEEESNKLSTPCLRR